MRLLLGILLFGMFAPIAGHAAEPHVYTLLGYPKENTGCLETALALGDALRSATGVVIQRSFCDKERDNNYDLRIVYEADTSLPLVSTEEKVGYAGTYASLAHCRADLDAQTSLFESRTRLRRFLAYCYQDESGLEKTVGARIDAFGTPVEWPQVFQGYVTAPPSSPRAIETELRTALQSQGLVSSVVAVLPSATSQGWYRIVMRYYGAEPVTFQLRQQELSYDSPLDCEAQLKSMKALLATQGLSAASAFCSWEGFLMRASMNFIAPWDVPWYRVEVADERFGSLPACLADRTRLVEYFKTVLKQPVFGAVCTRDRELAIAPSQRRYRAELLMPCSKFGASECGHPIRSTGNDQRR